MERVRSRLLSIRARVVDSNSKWHLPSTSQPVLEARLTGLFRFCDSQTPNKEIEVINNGLVDLILWAHNFTKGHLILSYLLGVVSVDDDKAEELFLLEPVLQPEWGKVRILVILAGLSLSDLCPFFCLLILLMGNND